MKLAYSSASESPTYSAVVFRNSGFRDTQTDKHQEPELGHQPSTVARTYIRMSVYIHRDVRAKVKVRRFETGWHRKLQTAHALVFGTRIWNVRERCYYKAGRCPKPKTGDFAVFGPCR